jgi:hypothetical protein
MLLCATTCEVIYELFGIAEVIGIETLKGIKRFTWLELAYE